MDWLSVTGIVIATTLGILSLMSIAGTVSELTKTLSEMNKILGDIRDRMPRMM